MSDTVNPPARSDRWTRSEYLRNLKGRKEGHRGLVWGAFAIGRVEGKFNCTHLATGLRVFAAKTQKDARLVCEKLQSLGDWDAIRVDEKNQWLNQLELKEKAVEMLQTYGVWGT